LSFRIRSFGVAVMGIAPPSCEATAGAPDRFQETLAAFNGGLSGNRQEIETAMIRKDGSRVERVVSGAPIRVGGPVTGVTVPANLTHSWPPTP
jgi:hypothetical protein